MMMKVIKSQEGDALEVYIAEYNNLWQETLIRIDAQKQILNLQIGVIAASASGVAFLQAQPILYLFGALLLSLLSWIMMEQTARINNIITFIRTVLATKIENKLPDLEHPVLEWSSWVITLDAKNSLWEMLSLIKFIIGPFIVILFCVFFAIAKQTLATPWSNTETILFTSTIITLLIPVLVGLSSVLITYRRPKTKKQK